MFTKDSVVKLKIDKWCLGTVIECSETHATVLSGEFRKGLDGKHFCIEKYMKVPLEQLEIVV